MYSVPQKEKGGSRKEPSFFYFDEIATEAQRKAEDFLCISVTFS